MQTANYDLLYLKSGIDQLERYLLSKEIYWSTDVTPPAGKPPYPQLTLGNLLLAHLRSAALAQTPEETALFSLLNHGLSVHKNKWQIAWGTKARAEFRARLNLWAYFIEEYHHHPEAHFDRYPYEVRRRVILHLLEQEADNLSQDNLQLLTTLDGFLHAVFIPGDFIWEKEVISSFPLPTYWFLYGRLPIEFKNSAAN